MIVEEFHGRMADLFMDLASINSRRIDGKMLIKHHLAAFGDFIKVDIMVSTAWDERKGCFFDLFSENVGAFSNRSDVVPFRGDDVDGNGDFLEAVVVKEVAKSRSHDKDCRNPGIPVRFFSGRIVNRIDEIVINCIWKMVFWNSCDHLFIKSVDLASGDPNAGMASQGISNKTDFLPVDAGAEIFMFEDLVDNITHILRSFPNLDEVFSNLIVPRISMMVNGSNDVSISC